jgi:hypothetical protein
MRLPVASRELKTTAAIAAASARVEIETASIDVDRDM